MNSNCVVKMRAAGCGVLLLLMPLVAAAQQASGIAGVVRDTSGAVLPGVTVEVASPALIEGVRTVFTDGQGRYNVVDLRPGMYIVTFVLPGFNTFRREGIVLTAGFTATVNADLQVGALEETVTVTGEAPLVDTQNVRQQNVVSNELIATLPTGTAGLMGIVRVVPGLSSGAVEGGGGAAGIYGANRVQGSTLHGKGGTRQMYDGMNTLNLAGTGNTTYIMNPATVEEVVVQTGGISAESDSGGMSINMVPKEGGNTFSYGADFTYGNEHFQGDNLSDSLRARGLTRPSKLLHAYDVNVTTGGPIRRDRVWFFAATRLTGTKNEAPDLFFNDTQGTPFYTPGRPAFYQDWLKSQAVRMTWQLSPRNRMNVFADPQSYQTRGQGTNTAPEAQTCWNMWPVGMYQATWTAPVTSRLLLEAGGGLTQGRFPCSREDVTQTFDFTVKPTDVSILEASTGLRYNAASTYRPINDQDRYAERFSASYVTGTHTFKVGFQLQQHVKDEERVVNEDVDYTFNRGVPTRITQWATPYLQLTRTKADLGIYAQDQWAIGRLTMNYGLRFDYFNGYVPEQHVPATRFVAARDFAPVHDVPEWTDLNPRVGGSYDLFGTGRTALKASLGRYVGRMGVNVAEANNPIQTSVNNVNRAWNDGDGDYVPDCDLTNFAANGECGPIDNTNFGQVNPNAVRYADDLIRGFGNRDYFWDFATEIQHEIGLGMSMTGGYYRNWTDHFGSLDAGWSGTAGTGVIDNLAVTPDDFDPYCVTAPVDPLLPGGGGYDVCGLYDIRPAKFGAGDVVVTRPSHYGGKSRASDFFTVAINTRLEDVQFGASLDTGRTVEDNCFVVDSPEQLLNCRVVTPFKSQTQIKVHGSSSLPGGIVVSGVFQNVSGVSYSANYRVRNDDIAPSLGRNLAACGTRAVCTASVAVPLVAPQTLFEPRRNVLDLRLSKIFTMGSRMRLQANLDVYNVLNAGSILTINHNYGASWRLPEGRAGGIMPSRLIQFGGRLTY